MYAAHVHLLLNHLPIVEHRPDVSERVIERHEEAAEVAAVALDVLGLVALGTLVPFRGSLTMPRGYRVA